MKIGEVSKPRFEFRSFGQCFCEAHKRMARLSAPVPEKVWERLSDEIYIISRKNDINNTKIRDGKMGRVPHQPRSARKGSVPCFHGRNAQADQGHLYL